MILADFVKDVSFRNDKKAKKYEEEVSNEVINFKNTAKSFLNLVQKQKGSINSNLRSEIEELVESFNNSLNDKKKETPFLEMKPVSGFSEISYSRYNNEFTESIKPVPDIYKASRTTMDDIINVAEKLGLLIIPCSYVNKDIIDGDKYRISNGNQYYVSNIYKSFVRNAKNNYLNAWLICPVQYYNIQEHAKDLSYEFFVPSLVRQSFTSIKIILPMLIGMINQIENLSKKVDNISSELKNINSTLIQQQEQINRLQEELTAQRIQIAEQAARERQMEAALMEVRESIRWDMFDPMLIAVPDSVKNINTYKGNVVLGPAWGPEIDSVLVDLLGLGIKTERKNYMDKEFSRYL